MLPVLSQLLVAWLLMAGDVFVGNVDVCVGIGVGIGSGRRVAVHPYVSGQRD